MAVDAVPEVPPAPEGGGGAGRVALVTGGGRGVGRAISRRLAADGCAVAVNWRRDEASALAVVDEIRQQGGSAAAYQASVDRPEDDARMVDQVLADFGHVDILVNNGGIASRGASVADTDLAELERVMATHAVGPFLLCQLLVPQMRDRPRGDVVMVSSVTSTQGPPNAAPYTMGKSALEALARSLAREERDHGIRVNVVAPGLVATDMGDRLTRALTGGEVADAADLDARSPFGRVCRPEDVAGVVSFLVSADAEYVTGQRIVVDGGAPPVFG